MDRRYLAWVGLSSTIKISFGVAEYIVTQRTEWAKSRLNFSDVCIFQRCRPGRQPQIGRLERAYNSTIMRILVVEDERRVASFISRALRENSYAVDVADNGEKAIDSVSATSYDCVLLDVRLPGVSGVEACRRIRE